MHGRKKKEQKVLSEEEKIQQKEQAAQGHALLKSILSMKHSGELSRNAFEITTEALKVHPEVPTVWNYRRQLIDADSNRVELMMGDRLVTQKALSKVPKSYCVWFHRNWLIKRLSVDLPREEFNRVLFEELGLCKKFFLLDSRNFHCWNYRQFLTSLLVREEAEKLDREDSLELIQQDFSNYSAWHIRSLLPRTPELFLEDLELLRQAYYTEPSDQSVWSYHHWLLFGGEEVDRELLEEEWSLVWDLIQEENGEGDLDLVKLIEDPSSPLPSSLPPSACPHQVSGRRFALLSLIKLEHALGRGGKDRWRRVLEVVQVIDPCRRGLYEEKIKEFL